MPEADDYIEINKKAWNDRVNAHVRSSFYDVEGFLAGKSSLNDIEIGLLGALKGKRVLHLQCHFGLDSISLARLGADVTGIDFSEEAISVARQLASQTGQSLEFICCNLYDLPSKLEGKFDMVFTSYGVIGWLPDLREWARIITHYLKPGGRIVLVEFHPFVWMFDTDFQKIEYNYFSSGAIVETSDGTYADRETDITLTTFSWNHSLSEVIGSLLENKMEICSFDEYDYSPYNCFKGTVESEPGKFRIEKMESRIPMVYSILAVKKNPGQGADI